MLDASTGWTPRTRVRLRARLRRHPFAVQAHFQDCLTLTYALPAAVLRPLLPPGLDLDTAGGLGFVAIALVETEALRPAGLPAALGQDFFLAGYRIFATFRAAGGRQVRGLYILRSDANRAVMVAAGNLLTHYNYHHCDARADHAGPNARFAIDTPDHLGDLRLTANPIEAGWPAGSPFPSVKAARRFAGPLPFTFDYEPETHAIVAIKATRANWRPQPVSVTVERLSFFDQPVFQGCSPVLAAAFRVSDIDYRWERGVHCPLPSNPQEGRA